VVEKVGTTRNFEAIESSSSSSSSS